MIDLFNKSYTDWLVSIKFLTDWNIKKAYNGLVKILVTRIPLRWKQYCYADINTIAAFLHVSVRASICLKALFVIELSTS